MNNEFDDEVIIDIFDDEHDSRRRYIVCKEGKYSLSKKQNGDAVVQKWFDSIKEVENYNQPTYVVSMGEIYYIVDVDLNPIFDFTLPKYDYYEIIYSNREPLKPAEYAWHGIRQHYPSVSNNLRVKSQYCTLRLPMYKACPMQKNQKKNARHEPTPPGGLPETNAPYLYRNHSCGPVFCTQNNSLCRWRNCQVAI